MQGLKPQTRPSSIPFIEDVLNDKTQFFISLTETWLLGHSDAELDIIGYTLYRADRDITKRVHSSKGRLSGGVACYVLDDIAATMTKLLAYSNGVVECLILYSKTLNLAIVTLYRQPDTAKNRSTAVEFADCLNCVSDSLKALGSPDPHVLFLGDFNLPNISWSTNSCSGPKAEKDCYLVLKDILDSFCLSQFIFSPTHREGNVLDLVFTNDDMLFHSYNVIDVLQSTSHHKIIEVASLISFEKQSNNKHSCSTPIDCCSLKKFNFYSDEIDWQSINSAFASIDWHEKLLTNCKSVDEIYENLLTICIDVLSKQNVPLKPAAKPFKCKIPRFRRRLMSKRRRALNRLNGSKPLRTGVIRKLKTKLAEIEESLMHSYSKQTNHEERRALGAIKKNPKFFYSFASKFAKSKSKIGPLIDPNSQTVVNDQTDMANILADQFSSVYTVPSDNLPSADVLFPDDESLPFVDFTFSIADLLEAILCIKTSSAPGPDGFSALLLKKCASSLVVPLHILWSKCFENGVTPASLKIPVVFPLHKGGSRGEGVNYRPITSSSHVVKVFERVVSKKIVTYLDSNSLFNPNQHGFRKRRSCLTELLSHFEEIYGILESGGFADVVYLDFSKAFDKVDFSVLLHKLKSVGIGGKLGCWIYSFLVGRYHYVCVNGCLSTLRSILSGVPQGSVLGPLLFLILISDIDRNVLYSSLRSFADDSRMTKSIKSLADSSAFQQDLNSVYDWAELNKLVFNESKFEMIRYTPTTRNSDGEIEAKYSSPNGLDIPVQSSISDLGVTLSSDGFFATHIENVLSKMRSKCSWIFRTFSTRSQDLLTVWKSLVIPLHDYCSQLWSPHKVKDICALEKVQWNFIGKLNGVSSNYWLALKQLKLYSLQRRRERYMIMYIWKVLENIAPPIIDRSGRYILFNKFNDRLGRSCSVPPLVNRGSQFIQTMKNNSFFVLGAQLFNILPQSIRDITNCKFEVFKSAVDIFLSSVPDEPHLNGYTNRTNGSVSNCLLNMYSGGLSNI